MTVSDVQPVPRGAVAPSDPATGASGRRIARPAAALYLRWEHLAVLGAIILGAVIRGRYVIVSGFPLRDGGMFFVMTRELEKAHFSLPAFTSFNSAGIPFAYPPLGFYIAGLLSSATHISLLSAFHYLPFAISVLTVVAFYWLARSILTSKVAVAAGTVAFATLPGTFVLTIAGGGITRALGLFFAILALCQIRQMYQWRQLGRLIAASILSGLTVLSHPEAPVFLGLSALVMCIFFGRDRVALRFSALLALGTLLMTAPWWVAVLVRHGAEPFLLAAHSGGAGLSGILAGAVLLTTKNVTAETFFPIAYALAIVGLLCRSRDGKRFLGWWAVVIALLDFRGMGIYVTVPLALLAGVGVADGLLPMLAGAEHELRSSSPERQRWAAFVLGCIVIYATVAGMLTATRTLAALSPENRQAMEWVAANTPDTSRFLVVNNAAATGAQSASGADWWVGQRFENTSEWFPALTGRESVATPQGREWIAPDFGDRVRDYLGLQVCADRSGDCLESWAKKTGVDFQYVYLPKESDDGGPTDDSGACCWPLRNALRADPRFRTVFDGPGATVFVLLPAVSRPQAGP